MSCRKNIVSILLLINIVFVSLFGTSCSSKAEDSRIRKYLGQYSYDASISALVFEQVEGEEEGFYGIQYRDVTDLDGLLKQDDVAVCLFFYSSTVTSTSGITPGVEDLAQTLTGRVIFVAIDAFQEAGLSTGYEVEAYPEFILIKGGTRISTFGSSMYDYWDIDDVAAWMNRNGYAPDYSMLEY